MAIKSPSGLGWGLSIHDGLLVYQGAFRSAHIVSSFRLCTISLCAGMVYSAFMPLPPYRCAVAVVSCSAVWSVCALLS